MVVTAALACVESGILATDVSMKRLLYACLTFALLLAASLACAQADVQHAYDAALERSLKAHAQNDFQAAESAMREAHALSPNARTLRGLGVLLYAQGRYVEAVEPLEAALVSEAKPLGAELRKGVEELLSRVWQRVGRLTLQVEPASRTVRIDGAPPLLHGSEIVLAVGEHQVEITAPAREPYTLTLRTQAGSRDSLHVVLASLRPAPVAAPERQEQTAPTAPVLLHADGPRREERWTPHMRIGLLAGGGALLVAGAASWLTAFVRFEDLRSKCERDDGCDPTWASSRFKDKNIESLNVAGIALVATGAAALVTVGVVELWHWRGSQRARSSNVRLSVAGSALTLRGQF
jgi:hypothetical protein